MPCVGVRAQGPLQGLRVLAQGPARAQPQLQAWTRAWTQARALTRDLRPKLSVGGDGGVYIEAACYLLTVGLERELSNTCDLPTALSGYYAYTDVQNRAHSAPC